MCVNGRTDGRTDEVVLNTTRDREEATVDQRAVWQLHSK